LTQSDSLLYVLTSCYVMYETNARAVHGFFQVTNCVHIAWTHIGRHSILK